MRRKDKRKTYQGEDDDSIHGNMRWIATASCAEENTSEQLEVSDWTDDFASICCEFICKNKIGT